MEVLLVFVVDVKVLVIFVVVLGATPVVFVGATDTVVLGATIK